MAPPFEKGGPGGDFRRAVAHPGFQIPPLLKGGNAKEQFPRWLPPLKKGGGGDFLVPTLQLRNAV